MSHYTGRQPRWKRGRATGKSVVHVRGSLKVKLLVKEVDDATNKKGWNLSKRGEKGVAVVFSISLFKFEDCSSQHWYS